MSTNEKEIVSLAQTRWERCNSYYANWEMRAKDDERFVNADSYNGYQWPTDVLRGKSDNKKPALTINKTKQHCLQIINDAKKNRPGLMVRPVSGGASYQSAQILGKLFKHTQYISKFEDVFDTAVMQQVYIGKGFIRVTTDYSQDEGFDQEIYFKRVKNTQSVYLDPDAVEFDKSDARFGFIFEDVPKDVFAQRYPQYGENAERAPAGTLDNTWMTEDHVRIAEYYYQEVEDLWIMNYVDLNGQRHTIREKDEKKEVLEGLKKLKHRRKKVQRKYFMRVVIVGHEICEGPDEWPGKYIPIVPMIGEESFIDNQYDCWGHVRALLDPQRIYNYWSSAAVEYGALQTKIPWIAPAQAIEGYKEYWENANKENFAYLPYNALDDAGEKIPPPERIQPPMAAPVALEGMKIAGAEFMMASGQYENSMGEQGNERTGAAIEGRQRQGETSTYHFIDNQGKCIAQLGRILIDLYPKIYDTERIMMILNDDNTNDEVKIDPQSDDAYQAIMQDGEVVQHIFNPSVGIYEVEAYCGPNSGTMRQQAFDAILQIVTQSPEAMHIIGDLLFQNADFPNSDIISQRYKRTIPNAILGKGDSVEVQQLKQTLMQGKQLLDKTMQENMMLKLKIKGKEELRDIEAQDSKTKQYDADTRRMKVHQDALEAHHSRQMEHAHHMNQLDHDEQQGHLDRVMNAQSKESKEGEKVLNAVQDANADEIPPVPGALKSGDDWYVHAPHANGQYQKVVRNG